MTAAHISAPSGAVACANPHDPPAHVTRTASRRAGEPRPTTIYDVAKLAGVSHQTVSRVINGSRGVAESTSARVRVAIDQLGWKANTAAQTLRSRRRSCRGVVVIMDEITPQSLRLLSEMGRHTHDEDGPLLVEFVHTNHPTQVDSALRRLHDGNASSVAVLGAAGLTAAI